MTCNSCFENGMEKLYNCKTCKFGYEKFENNCVKCDKNNNFQYYNSNLNNNECLYNNNNNCPND